MVKDKCQNCGAELSPTNRDIPCPKCGKSGEIHKAYERSAFTAIGLVARANSRARNKEKGYKKFKKEIEQGWFPSGDPELKDGVDKVRIADKEHDDYYEITRDFITGEITHEIHEPLSQHVHVNTKNEKELNTMGSKGRKNTKKPKQDKSKKPEPPQKK